MGLEAGQTLDTTIPDWLKHSERHPKNSDLVLVYFVRKDDSLPTVKMVFRGIVNENGWAALSRLSPEGFHDYIFTFPLERISPMPSYLVPILPIQ